MQRLGGLRPRNLNRPRGVRPIVGKPLQRPLKAADADVTCAGPELVEPRAILKCPLGHGLLRDAQGIAVCFCNDQE